MLQLLYFKLKKSTIYKGIYRYYIFFVKSTPNLPINGYFYSQCLLKSRKKLTSNVRGIGVYTFHHYFLCTPNPRLKRFLWWEKFTLQLRGNQKDFNFQHWKYIACKKGNNSMSFISRVFSMHFQYSRNTLNTSFYL